MLRVKWSAVLWILAAGIAAGQPTLTTIQDVLYRADGTRFTGTMFIDYNSFEGGDTSAIATAHLTLPIVNGVLKIALVPTTTASAGAQYNITYNSGGRNQFTEIWAVPPTSLVLRVRDVRVSSGTIVGPPPVTTSVQISDVTGLVNQLAIRPQEGIGFTVGRAAVINSSGELDGATGNLSDCVRVDGSSGPCGSGSGGGGVSPLFSDGETPGGAVNGSNTVFTLLFAPSPQASLDLYRNGLLMKLGTDYTLNTNVITFITASTPQVGDLVVASYRYANPSNPLGSLAAGQVVCSSTGSNTTATTLTQLGSCTIPAGLLGVGDRIEVQFQYAHSGTSTGFTGEIHWGGTTVFSRSGGTSEAGLSGRITLGLISGSQGWDVESWGASTALAASLGSASEDITQNLTVSLRGQMSGSTTDAVNLRNFTVIRYPAQTNP
ncbi:MAG: hypothetical protein LAO79_18885 [Acidobacteriia bacterium]|nr:hypothetical protein [Terriglobia bacterium]